MRVYATVFVSLHILTHTRVCVYAFWFLCVCMWVVRRHIITCMYIDTHIYIYVWICVIQTYSQGWFSSIKCAYSVESGLQANSSNSILWKQNNGLVVIQTRFDVATLRPALEHGSGKKHIMSACISFSRTNLLYVPNIEMFMRV